MMGNTTKSSRFISSLSKEGDFIFGTLYLFFGILSLFGNTVLLFVAYRKRSMLKPAEFFIINLAVSDLAMTLSLFPLAIPSLFAHRWLFNLEACLYYAFCGVLFGLCSLTNLTVLSFVCCLKVCYPAYGNKFSSTHAWIMLLCVWVYASIFAFGPLSSWGTYGPEPYGTACCIDWHASKKESNSMSYVIALFVFCYLLPCVVIVISYCLILLTVKGSRRAVKQHVSPQTKVNNIHNLIVKLSIAVCLGFVAAWTPYAITAMWVVFAEYRKVPTMAFAVSAVFAKSSTIYNPIVYLLLKPNFRKFLTKDFVVLQRTCSRTCCDTKTDATLRTIRNKDISNSTKLSNEFIDYHGTCRNCTDTFECFSNYPKCCHPVQNMDSMSKINALILSDKKMQPTFKRTVRMLSETTRSGVDTTEVVMDSLPSNIKNDFM
ncbi:opsin-5 [Latimeria chalumnae]|uniref:opsin-5 n=1 Tax=Latimeria chalumnae TaxID=7897 RepID=UPI00313EA78A